MAYINIFIKVAFHFSQGQIAQVRALFMFLCEKVERTKRNRFSVNYEISQATVECSEIKLVSKEQGYLLF